MPIRSRLWATALILALGGCQSPAQAPADRAAGAAPPKEPEPVVNVYAYACGDLAVVGQFSLEQVELAFRGKTLVLPHAMAASGARYADDQGNEFWGKGLKDATLTLAGESQRTCTGSGEALPSQARPP